MDKKDDLAPKHGQLQDMINHIYMDALDAVKAKMNSANAYEQHLFNKVDMLSHNMRREEDIFRFPEYFNRY